jgi:deoxyribose-phosphate aldolase
MIDVKDICARIDHTLLRPDATLGDIRQLCAEARHHQFYGVCVNGCRVSDAGKILKGSDVKIIAVVGFPLGAMCQDSKAVETEIAVGDGADEIDFVMNIGRLKDGDRRYVLKEIKNEVKSAGGRPVKVILETCLLTREEKILACRLTVEGGAHFVKTSTGFAKGGATVSDIELMRESVGPDFGVKASGGIRDLQTAAAMIHAGANRLGASASVAIIKGERE